MRRRLLLAGGAAVAIWWLAVASASATGHCSGTFILDQHACEVAHHGPLVAIMGGLVGVIALIGSGLTDGSTGIANRDGSRQRRQDDEASAGPNTLNTQDPRPDPDAPRSVETVRPRVEPLDPGLPDLEPLDLGEPRPRVEPLDPGLPDLEPLVVDTGVIPSEVLKRWTELGADGAGRIVDRTGQQILSLDPDGTVRDLAGNPVREVASGWGNTRFTDAQGRDIEYNAVGEPRQRIRTETGNVVFQPVTDLPASVETRPELTPEVNARWTGVAAGVDGEIYGSDGRVIGRIDPDGVMRTLDGTVITGHAPPEGGRVPEYTTASGERVRTPGAPEPRPVDTSVGGTTTTGGDPELAELVRRTTERQATQRADTDVNTGPETGDGAATNVREPTAEGDTRASAANDVDGVPPPDGAHPTPDAPDAPSPAEPLRPAAEGDAPARRSGEEPPPAEAAGPRGMDALSGVMDLQGAIDQVQREMGEGRSAGEALTRAVAMTHVGNAIGERVTTNLLPGNGLDVGRVNDVRITLLGSAILPNGINNLLPDQMAANTIGTGIDALRALTGDLASSLGGGEIDTTELDSFTQRLADRPGADPWAGYARLGDLLGEEMGNSDTGLFSASSNLASEAWTLREDMATELGESWGEFGQAAAQGRHGAVLQGYAEVAQALGDPPDPSALASDLGTMVEVMIDDFGGGETGGFGGDFWQAQADHANQTVRSVPIVGTVFDGYTQIASGIEEQGLEGFSTDMSEGAYALGSEAVEATANAASQTIDYLRSWF